MQPARPSDGDFGTLGEGGLGSTGTGFTILSDYTVTLYNYNPITGQSSVVVARGLGQSPGASAQPGQHALGRRLPGLLPQPARARRNSTRRIFDIYGNQLDGENLGNQTSPASPDFPTLPELRRPAVRRHQSPERHERRRRGRRRVHGRASPSSTTATSFSRGPTTSRTRSCRAPCPTARWPTRTRFWQPRATRHTRRPIPTTIPTAG